MDFNLANGGLVMQTGGKLFLSDIRGFAGTTMLDVRTGEQTVLDGVMWFMNGIGSTVYYSDQNRGNELYRFDMDTQTSELLQAVPCYGLVHHGEWFYYVNENDRKLYRCGIDGKQQERIADDQVIGFFAEEQRIVYSTKQGIRSCNLGGGERETVSDAAAAAMIMVGQRIAFADKGNGFVLTTLDLKTGETSRFEDISPVSLNSDGRYLYATNRQNDRTVYRIDPEQGSRIRICGESADYLHILGDVLYFCGNSDWFKMFLSGGQPVKATMRS